MDKKLIDFVTHWTQVKNNDLKPDLFIAQDLGLVGLDALGFFEEFFAEFSIENTKEFDSNLYINGGPDFGFSLLDWAKNLFIKERRKYLNPDITIGHLDKVVELGKWFDEKKK